MLFRSLDMAKGEGSTPALEKHIHKLIKKVTADIDSMKFNTAIAAMMAAVNTVYEVGKITKCELMTLAKLLSPFAPHLAEEVYEALGGDGLCSLAKWPEYDEAKTVDATVEIAVQINGKVRANVEIPMNCDKDAAIAAAKAVVASYLEGKTVVKEICVPNKIVNIVIKP